jgi:hypothetical protein
LYIQSLINILTEIRDWRMLVGGRRQKERKRGSIGSIDFELTVGLRAAAAEAWQMRLGFDRRMPWMSS